MFMLTASHFVLNGIFNANKFQVYPWLERTSNVVDPEDPCTAISVPDIPATDILTNGLYNDIESVDGDIAMRFSMAAGDFVSIYGSESNRGQWDAVGELNVL